MMRSLYAILPNVDDLLALSDAELGLLVLQLLNERERRALSQNDITSPLFQLNSDGYPSNRKTEVLDAVAEGWAWLQSQALVAKDPGQSPSSSFFFVTRRGKRIRTNADADAYRRAAELPRSLIHYAIRDKVMSLMLRGDYDTAVFQAFKEVEVAVRWAGGYTDENIGTALMRKAFDVEEGPLTDKEALRAERQALSDLFAGAIGSYKNPQSHRHVGIPAAEEAAEMLILASHLLRIVETMDQRVRHERGAA